MATPIPHNRARITAQDAAQVTGGALVKSRARDRASPRRSGSSPEEAVGIFSDSRAVVPGCAFVALKGERFDGHAFVEAAVASGASLVVVERGRGADAGDVAVVEVDDTLVAWGALGRAHLDGWRRAQADGAPAAHVVAITGSAGKTTTKTLCAALLAEVAPTHATAGNLNNRIGVPAVLFGLEPHHTFVVVEVGMSLPGDQNQFWQKKNLEVGAKVFPIFQRNEFFDILHAIDRSRARTVNLADFLFVNLLVRSCQKLLQPRK